jgi:hypothetical protein
MTDRRSSYIYIYLLANFQAMLIVSPHADVENFQCIRGIDLTLFQKLVDGLHEAGELHFVRKSVNVHGKFGVFELLDPTI